MASKLPVISTKRGDKGETSLWSGERVRKNHPSIKCLSEIDLMDSFLGIIKSKVSLETEDSNTPVRQWIDSIQSDLVFIKGEIATSPENWDKYGRKYDRVSKESVLKIESFCDKIREVLEHSNYSISGWVKYGDGSTISAEIDVCRAYCRQSEIAIYDLEDFYEIKVSEFIKEYLNRMSDFLYLMARIF